jgi:hypothetical protein
MSNPDLSLAIKEFDLVRYCQDHAADQVSNEDWIMGCPECGKKKLTVTIKKQAWHCWVCEGHSGGRTGRGGLVSLICLLDGCSPKEAVNRIFLGGRFCSLPIDHLPEGFVNQVFTDIDFPAIPPPEFYRNVLLDGILPYMVKRGITLEDAAAFGLAWCFDGRYKGRLMFPVWESGKLLYYQGRAMWEAKDQSPGTKYTKSLNPPGGEGHAVSSDVLMNLDVAKCYPRVAIVEGPIDCVKTGPSAVCTFGKRIYPRQIGSLIRAGIKAVDLMWDGPTPKEPQGTLPEMMGAAPLLSAFFDTRIVLLEHGDPGERTRQELDWYREKRSQPAGLLSQLAVL